jgi:hypothetical protein
MKTTNTKNCLSRDVSKETKLRISHFIFDGGNRYSDQISFRLTGIKKVLTGLFNIAISSGNGEEDNLITNDFILGLSGLLACEINIIKILVEGAEAEGDEKMDIVEKTTLEGE